MDEGCVQRIRPRQCMRIRATWRCRIAVLSAAFPRKLTPVPISSRPEAPRPSEPPAGDDLSVMRWTVLALVALAVLTILPLWVPLVLAAWSAILTRPLNQRVARLVGGRSRAAGMVTVVLVLAVLTPVVITALSLSGSMVDLLTRVQHTEDGAQAMSALLSSESSPAEPVDLADTRQLFELIRRHGLSAIDTARTLFGAVAAVAVGLFVFVFAFYTFLVDGTRAYRWLLDHSPLSPAHSVRMAAAFEETGRGLFLSLGGTALFQGTAATLGYLVIGVPQALMLGMLTFVGSFIPLIGTALVWVPVTTGLLLVDRSGQAIAVLVLGLVVSSLDNFVRPWLSRYGDLQLPTFVIFVAMLGGIAAFGGAGPLLGPLIVRLAVEAMLIWRQEQTRRQGVPDATAASLLDRQSEL
jgi:predicted PurR-regulated permease PerM